MQSASQTHSIATFQLSYAASLNLGQSQYGVLGKGLRDTLKTLREKNKMPLTCTFYFSHSKPSPRNSIGSIEVLRTGGRWFEPPARPIFFPWFDDSHCDRIHTFITAVRRFDHGYVGKQSVALKEYNTEDRL